jgi:5-formyltetrahydrofolate cyclo-ligase
MGRHDVSLDLFATPKKVVKCPREYRRPAGILWKELEAEKRAAIPVLARGRL